MTPCSVALVLALALLTDRYKRISDVATTSSPLSLRGKSHVGRGDLPLRQHRLDTLPPLLNITPLSRHITYSKYSTLLHFPSLLLLFSASLLFISSSLPSFSRFAISPSPLLYSLILRFLLLLSSLSFSLLLVSALSGLSGQSDCHSQPSLLVSTGAPILNGSSTLAHRDKGYGSGSCSYPRWQVADPPSLPSFSPLPLFPYRTLVPINIRSLTVLLIFAHLLVSIYSDSRLPCPYLSISTSTSLVHHMCERSLRETSLLRVPHRHRSEGSISRSCSCRCQ